MKEFLFSFPGIVTVLGFLSLVIIRFIKRKERSLNEEGKETLTENKVRLIMQIVVSVAMCIAGLYIILSDNYPADTSKWAYGIVGMVVGYWLPAR